ncbi:MAG TPA: hypothetical protein PKJ10_06895 [Smithella sp.]|nr:hypothetical protein [Smithella sp.]
MHSFDENDMLEYWWKCYRNRDYLAAFWGIVTRLQTSEKAKYEIFGTVHMSMHKMAELRGSMNMLEAELPVEVKCQ